MLSYMRFVLLIVMLLIAYITPEKQMTIGLITDVQYCDCAQKSFEGSHRYFRTAPDKLRDAVHTMNDANVDFAVNLGDTIEQGVSSLNTITPIYRQITSPLYHLLGNHDFPKQDYSMMDHLDMPYSYYTFARGNYRFVMLDTNEISTYAHRPDSAQYHQAKTMLAKLKQEGKPYAKDWNGGISTKQLHWLDRTLQEAKDKREKVIIFAHQAVYPEYNDNVLNKDIILRTIDRHQNVVAYFNGHTHTGKYHIRRGVHYVNLKAMVDSPHDNAYSILTLTERTILLKGYGREPSRKLKLKEVYAEK